MAELTEISINIKIDLKPLQNLSSHFDKLASTIETTGKKVESTFNVISRQLIILARNFHDTEHEISLFGISFDILKDRTGTLADLKFAIERFKEALVFTNKDFIKDLTAFFSLLTQIVQRNPELTKFVTTMAAIGAVVLPLVLGLGALAGAAKAVGAVFAVSGGEIAAIVAVIALVIAIVVLLIQNWDLVEERTKEKWESVKESVSNAVDTVIQSIEGIAQRISTLWEGLKENAASVWEGIKETISEKIISLLQVFDLIKEGINNKFAAAVETIETLWSNGIQFIKDNTGLDEFVLSLAETILKIFNKMVEGLKQLWNNFLTFLKENFPQVFDTADFVKEKLGDAKDFVGEKIGNAGDVITNTADVVVGFLKEKSGDLNNFLSERLGELSNFASNQLDTAGNFVKEQATNVGSFVEEQANNAKQSLKNAFSGENIVNAIEQIGPLESLAVKGARSVSGLLSEFNKIRKDLDETGNQTNKTGKEVSLLDSILSSLRGEAGLVDKSLVNNAQNLNNYRENVNQAGEATKKWTEEELEAVIQKIQEINETLPEISFREIFPGVKVPFVEVKKDIQEVGETFKDTSDYAQQQMDNLGEFTADVAAEINNTFADLIYTALKGDFDNLSDLWKSALDSMLKAFAQFIATVISNPIRIGLETFLSGSGGGGGTKGGGKGGDLGIGNFFQGVGSSPFAEGAIFGANRPIPFVNDPIGTQIGQLFTLGAPLIGAGLGFATGGLPGAIQGGLSGAGFLGGSILAGIPAIASALGSLAGVLGPLGALLGGLLGGVLGGLLKKTPRLDIDFDTVKTEMGRRAAEVAEFLDPDFFKDSIAQISVKRGGVGLGRGGDEGIKDIIQQKIKETVDAVRAIIFKLPSDIAAQLNEALLNTQVDTDTVVKGERLLEFDAKGKKIKEKFEAFINGELQAKFLFAIRDFFQGAFESLGVLPGKASEFLEAEFEKFKKAGSREERAKVGEELLADINAFVDAFNIVSGNVNDSIGQTLQSIDSLSADLGFKAVPSIGELRQELSRLLENAELDPETVQKYADLRNAIVQGISDIVNSITGLIGKISQLNSTIVSLGGSAVNVIPFLDEAQAKLLDFYTTNLDNLSLGEQESFLDELLGIANAKLAEEQAAFQRAQEARQKAEEAQRDAIQKRIDNLNKEKDKINEVFQERIDALNEELRIAEEFASLAESIRQTLDSILFSPESVLTGVEQVSALQSNIATLQAQLATATDPEKQLDIAGRLEDAFKTLFDTAGDAFGVNSPEFVAIFDQVTGGLENLAEFTEGRGRSVEEINAEIERLTAENEATLKSIDAKIEATQERLANIGQSTADNTFHASQELTELFEFIRSEYIRILEERFDQLGEVSEYGFATETEGLGVIAGLTDESLTVLRGMGEEAVRQTGYLSDIADRLKAVAGFQRGTGGFRDFGRGRLAILHGLEAVITTEDVEDMREALLQQIAGGRVAGLADRFAGEGPALVTNRGQSEGGAGDLTLNATINIHDTGGDPRMTARMVEDALYQSVKFGRLRGAVQEAARSRI